MANVKVTGENLTVPGLADVGRLKLGGGLRNRTLMFTDDDGNVGPASYATNYSLGYGGSVAIMSPGTVGKSFGGVVSGLNLPFVPKAVLAVARGPSGVLVSMYAVTASIIDGSISADGFEFMMSGDYSIGTLYYLDYFFIS